MLRFRIGWTGTPLTGTSLSTLYFANDDSGSAATSIRTALDTWLTAIVGQMHTSVTATLETEVTQVNEASGDPEGVVSISALTKTGTNAGGLLGPQMQWLMRWRTGDYLEGREVRGRTFIPGPTVNGTTGTGPTGAAKTAFETAAANLIATVGTWDFVVWQRPVKAHTTYNPKTGAAINHPARTGSAHTIETGSLWTKFGTLRSRRD